MTIKISHAKEAPTQKEILSAEEELCIRFPSEYLDFLSRNNGGIPETNIFKVSANIDSGVNEFIPFDKLTYEAKLIRDQIGQDFVPIAYAEGGNYLCLAVGRECEGSIFFMDHEIQGSNAMTKLAYSLSQFWEILRPFDPKQIRLKPGQVKKAWINPDFLKK